MKPRNIVAGVVIVMLVAACSTDTDESEPVGEIEVTPSIRPAASPTYLVGDGVLLVSEDDLAGVWFSLKAGLNYLFTTEGYFAAAGERSNVQNAPDFSGGFWFDGDTLYVEYYQVWSNAVEEYIGATNSFTVRQLPDGTIRFYKVDVTWEFVANALAGDGGLSLYFHRVD